MTCMSWTVDTIYYRVDLLCRTPLEISQMSWCNTLQLLTMVKAQHNCLVNVNCWPLVRLVVEPLLSRGCGLVRGDKTVTSAGTTTVLGYASDLTMTEGVVSTSGRRVTVSWWAVSILRERAYTWVRWIVLVIQGWSYEEDISQSSSPNLGNISSMYFTCCFYLTVLS